MILRSLPLRVLAVGFIVLALPLLIDTFIFFQHAYNESIKDAKEILKETANYRAFAISELDPVNPVVIDELSVLLGIGKNVPSDELNKRLEQINGIQPDLEVSFLGLEKEGNFKFVASSEKSLVGSDFETPYLLKKALEGAEKGDFIRFKYSSSLKAYVPFIFVVRTVKDKKTHEQLGFLVISAPIQEAIAPMLAQTKEHGLTINFAILTKDKIIFAASDPKLVGQFLTVLPPEVTLQSQHIKPLGNLSLGNKPLPLITSGASPFFEFIFQNQVQIAYEGSVPKLNLIFLAYTTKENLFSNSIKHFLLIYTIYGLIFVLGGGISYWLSTWISRPLMQLCKLMEKVGNGDLKVRFKEEPLGFEINLLGNIFNHTLDSLLENIQNVEDERVLKETLKKELELGQEAQRNLLPQKAVQVPGLEFATFYLSLQEVGGDFHDIFVKDNKRVGLVTADASGKGISGCLYALSVRSLMRTYMNLHDDVGVILSNTNNMFLKDTGDTGMFVTAFMGMYDIEKKILSYYSCGHVPGLVRRADGQIVMLSHSGLALGLRESTPFKPDSLELYPGDMLLLYTDGLIDISNDKHQHFGEKRLKNFLQQRDLKTPHEVIESLTEEVATFTKGVQQDEEISILCMKVL